MANLKTPAPNVRVLCGMWFNCKQIILLISRWEYFLFIPDRQPTSQRSVVNLIKHFTIVIYNSRVVWLEYCPYYNSSVVINDRKMFIRLATGYQHKPEVRWSTQDRSYRRRRRRILALGVRRLWRRVRVLRSERRGQRKTLLQIVLLTL